MTQTRDQSSRYPASRRIRPLYWITLSLLGLGLVLVAVLVAGEVTCRSCDRQRFLELHGRLQHRDETVRETVEGHQILKVILEDDRGLQVTAHIKVPSGGEPPYPALPLLGGARTGRHTLDYLPSTRGVILLTIDYPYAGKRSGLGLLEFMTALPEIRSAIIRTVPASMLAMDFLVVRSDVDPEQIALVGGSLAVLFAPAVGAADPRAE